MSLVALLLATYGAVFVAEFTGVAYTLWRKPDVRPAERSDKDQA